jgi:hypothetical protein
MAVLRTADERFANLDGFPYAPHYALVMFTSDVGVFRPQKF